MENSLPQARLDKNWDYRLSNKAFKNLNKFPSAERKRIFDALESMKSSPFAGDTKPIQGEENLYRRRAGSYRIYFRPRLGYKILDIPEITRKQSH